MFNCAGFGFVRSAGWLSEGGVWSDIGLDSSRPRETSIVLELVISDYVSSVHRLYSAAAVLKKVYEGKSRHMACQNINDFRSMARWYMHMVAIS